MEFVLLAQEMKNVWRCGTYKQGMVWRCGTHPQPNSIDEDETIVITVRDGMFHEALLGSAKCRGDPGTRSCFRALRHRMRKYPPARRLKVSALGVAARGLVFQEELAH